MVVMVMFGVGDVYGGDGGGAVVRGRRFKARDLWLEGQTKREPRGMAHARPDLRFDLAKSRDRSVQTELKSWAMFSGLLRSR